MMQVLWCVCVCVSGGSLLTHIQSAPMWCFRYSLPSHLCKPSAHKIRTHLLTYHLFFHCIKDLKDFLTSRTFYAFVEVQVLFLEKAKHYQNLINVSLFN